MDLSNGETLATLRHTRYQAAVLRNGALLLVRCAFRDGRSVWMLPGGGREEDEAEEACVLREVNEETAVHVNVECLLLDQPAEPSDGTYTRWRTYLCSVISGEAAPGGGEGANAELVDVTWLSLADDGTWPDDIRANRTLFPQLEAIRTAIAERASTRTAPNDGGD